MNWIKGLPPKDQRVFLWDVEKQTGTAGKLVEDEEYGSCFSAYDGYFTLECFSHYAIIEIPN